jgi:hypothetical protein
LYPDVAFQKVSYTSSRFMPIFEASRYISGLTVTLAPYNRATIEDEYQVLGSGLPHPVAGCFAPGN